MNRLNHIKSFLLFAGAAMIAFSSCDKGFEELNTNPNAYVEPVIPNLFSNALIRTAGTGTPDRNRTNIKYFAGTMQYMAALGTNWSGDKNFENGQFGDLFQTIYNVHYRELAQVLESTKDNPDVINQYAIATIWKVFTLHRATDIYGDVPYTEAGKGITEGIFTPKYDKQSEIYPMMLSELETATSQLDPSKASYGVSDVIYQGDVNKWKKFGYSLMLRLAMRLTNVDPATSQAWVQKAIEGGVFTSNQEMATLVHVEGSGNSQNWDAFELKRESLPESNKGKGPVKLSKTLIDMLQAKDDPRLRFYATLWEGNILATQTQVLPASSDPDLQKGLPNGYDASSIKTVIPGWSNDQLVDYSEPNTGTIANLNAPTVLLSYEEVEFLLAEAALRGWGPGTPAAHYNAAITASMQSTTIFPGDQTLFAIPQTDIDTYLAANPLDATGFEGQMEQIHTQFWLAHFMWYDCFEAFSNWRRTGYPVLTPPNYPGNFTGGQALLRLRYPISESSLNQANYEAAVANQGADLYTTPVWWDK
ncbi:MAG TPA: SusD/RagB family nutrient-binding outer membrane lipoprotein [Flavitalea sp.]|nr:SusD/RagB family nutrient-binding outer membrane lipoprotein [Flavitalea sp.]